MDRTTRVGVWLLLLEALVFGGVATGRLLMDLNDTVFWRQQAVLERVDRENCELRLRTRRR